MSCQSWAAARLPLPLLVAGFRADHAHHAVALDDLAVAAHLLDASQYLHVVLVESVSLRAKRDPGARQSPCVHAKAMHLKLDELIRAVSAARSRVVDLEDLSDDDLSTFEKEFQKLHEKME